MNTEPLLVGCGEWGFRELPVEKHFEIAQRFGFKFLEFGIGGNFPGRLSGTLSESEIDAFRALGKKYGLHTPFCCIENDFTLPDEVDHATMLRKTLGEIELAAKLGATHVRLFAGFTPAAHMTEEIWVRLLDAFQQSQALCTRLGLKIAIETHGKITMRNRAAFHEPTVSTDRSSLQRLLPSLPPEVGFNFDPGNLKAVAPVDRSLCLDLLNDRINYCHLKDWKRNGDGWIATAIGDDDLDYAPILKRMKFSGVYLIEYEPTHDVEEGIARSLTYLKKIGIPYRFQ